MEYVHSPLKTGTLTLTTQLFGMTYMQLPSGRIWSKRLSSFGCRGMPYPADTRFEAVYISAVVRQSWGGLSVRRGLQAAFRPTSSIITLVSVIVDCDYPTARGSTAPNDVRSTQEQKTYAQFEFFAF